MKDGWSVPSRNTTDAVRNLEESALAMAEVTLWPAARPVTIIELSDEVVGYFGGETRVSVVSTMLFASLDSFTRSSGSISTRTVQVAL